jgi:copper chaperone CopZ
MTFGEQQKQKINKTDQEKIEVITKKPDIAVYATGIVCSFCAQGLKKTFKKHPSIEKLDIDIESMTISIYLKEGKNIFNWTLKRKIKDAGFNIKEIKRSLKTDQDNQSKKSLENIPNVKMSDSRFILELSCGYFPVNKGV